MCFAPVSQLLLCLGAPPSQAYAIRTARYRYIANVHYDSDKYRPIWSPVISEQLYDYENDPHETINVASVPANAATVRELASELRELIDEF